MEKTILKKIYLNTFSNLEKHLFSFPTLNLCRFLSEKFLDFSALEMKKGLIFYDLNQIKTFLHKSLLKTLKRYNINYTTKESKKINILIKKIVKNFDYTHKNIILLKNKNNDLKEKIHTQKKHSKILKQEYTDNIELLNNTIEQNKNDIQDLTTKNTQLVDENKILKLRNQKKFRTGLSLNVYVS